MTIPDLNDLPWFAEQKAHFVADTWIGASGIKPYEFPLHLYTDCPLTVEEFQAFISSFGYEESLAIGEPHIRLVALFYILARDHLPIGEINAILKHHTDKTRGKDVEFCDVHLAAWARDCAKRLIGES